jgi:omega-6 fatty acid desaturase (delta-12 desaturase)
MSSNTHTNCESLRGEILSSLKPFQRPHLRTSVEQFVLTFFPLLLLWVLMQLVFDYSVLLALMVAIPTSIYTVRLFIIQHDCGHGSFFEFRPLNEALGWICSIFTSFPYSYWRHQHALHHASSGKLDGRGNGDVFLYTVREYLALSKWLKFKYRLVRHPLTMLLFGPFVLFFILNRFPWERSTTPFKIQLDLFLTNLLTFGGLALAIYYLGAVQVLGTVGPTIFFAGMIGIYLFYVQHQFEETYWERGKSWDFLHAALNGSTFFDLPAFLHWCTGNIGYHHIHHLAPKIPNYALAESHRAHPRFSKVKRESLRSSLSTFSLSLWDEESKRLISFAELKRRYLLPRR